MSVKDLRTEVKRHDNITKDRRIEQMKGEVDVHSLDTDDIDNLRDEDLMNLDRDELAAFEAIEGARRDRDNVQKIIPDRALHRDLEAEAINDDERLGDTEGDDAHRANGKAKKR